MGENNEKNSILRGYGRLCLGIFVILLVVIGAVEIVVLKAGRDAIDIYKVEIGRVENELREHAGEPGYEPDVSKYETILRVERYVPEYDSLTIEFPGRNSGLEAGGDLGIPGQDSVSESYDRDYFFSDSVRNDEFFASNNAYVIRDIAGMLYRIEYDTGRDGEGALAFVIVNIVVACVVIAVAIVLVYIYFAVIRNFHRLSDYPLELSKGNLTTPLKANKTRYFGRFLWGLDMLREKLESEKNESLELQKEKNVFLLSLSHDIKTPLSAIKLYSAALKKNLYTDPEKIREVAEKIDENAGEIENYVAKVISSSGDEFLSFDIRDGEFYLSEVLDSIRNYYSDKLAAVGTKLTFDKCSDVLIKGDRDRLIEVFQNIFENAIKYGDGREIGVTFEDEDGARLISVKNTGCTLSEEELGRIFDSFYRGSNVGSRGGSGLGLYICKKLMGRMKGDVFAEIVGDNEGTPTETTGDPAETTESMRQRAGKLSKSTARCMKVTVVCSKR